MKRICCTSCGASDLNKRVDNLFVCSFCGSVYQLDENENVQSKEIVEAKILSLFLKAEKYRLEEKYSYEIQTLTEILSLRDNMATTWVKLGRAYRMCNFVDKAIDCYYKAIAIDPYYAQSYTNLGTIFIIKKKYAQAVDLFEQGIPLLSKNDVDYPVVLANYGIATAKNGDKKKGAELLNEAESRGYPNGKEARKMAGLSIFSKYIKFHKTQNLKESET